MIYQVNEQLYHIVAQNTGISWFSSGHNTCIEGLHDFLVRSHFFRSHENNA